MVILSSGVGNYITLNRRKFSYFAGNDYLGLTHHPEVISAAIRSIEHYGNSFSASRQTGGFIAGRKKLIDKIRTESTIYQASTSLLPSIVGAGIAAIKVISEQPELRIRLITLAIKLKIL